MLTPPTTPDRSSRGSRPKWDVDRLSPRHQIFKRHQTSTFGSSARWFEELDALLNPSPGRSASQTTGSPLGSDRFWTSAGSQSTGSSKTSSQPQTDSSQSERQRRSPEDSRRVMYDRTYIPPIGGDDHDFNISCFDPLREKNATSTLSRKRGAAEALDEPMPLASDDHTSASGPQPAKRRLTTSSRFSSAKLPSDSSFPPTIKELEKMERKSSLKSRRVKVTRPALVAAHNARDSSSPDDSWLNSWFLGLPSKRHGSLQGQIECTTEKMRKLKVSNRMCGESGRSG